MYFAQSVVQWCPRKRTFVDKGDITLKQMSISEYCVRYVPDWGEHEPIDLWIERPETLVNDAGLVVSSKHPLAEFPLRYVTSPIGLRIPVVVSDEFFDDRSLPSIARITPGHCMKSFRWAVKNQSPITRAYDEENSMEAAAYQGRTRSAAAREIIDAAAAGGRLVGRRDREAIREIFRLSGGPTEEFLTEQCFLDISEMAASALDLLRTRQVRVHPNRCHKALEWHFAEIVAAKRSGANYELSDDWCISQQTAWGNDLDVSAIACRPGSCGRDTARRRTEHVLTLKMADALFAFYANRAYSQDPDRLREIAKASVCVTGLDLLLYWIAPMLMLSTALKEGLPFRDVVIHPLICDANGEKMSKSLRNTIEPGDMWERYGSDALRFSLLSCLNPGSAKMSFDETRVLEAKTLLEKIAKSIRTIQQSAASSDTSTDADRLFVQQIFESIDRALTEYDFMEAMKQVNRIMQQILAGSGDIQQSRRLLMLAALLEPFAPQLVQDAGLVRQQARPEDNLARHQQAAIAYGAM